MHPEGALLKLPFFTTDTEKKFFAILGLTFHSWSPPTLLLYHRLSFRAAKPLLSNSVYFFSAACTAHLCPEIFSTQVISVIILRSLQLSKE